METGDQRPADAGTTSDLPLYLAGWFAGAIPALAMITLLWLYSGPTTPFGDIALGAYALSFPVMVRRLEIPRRRGFVHFLLFAGLAFAVLSILTGWGNGLTDEPYTTPHFAGFLLAGHDPYTSPMTVAYDQYGRHLVSHSYYVYLPALMFLQVPGISYQWFSLACWALLVLLVRDRFDVATLLAQPYVMLVAASGYNDLVVLLLLSLGFVGLGGRRQKWAEWLSLGCKQFANAFVLLYYAVRRDWRNLLVTAGVSAAFVAPFLAWGGTAVACPAVFANRLPSCTHGGGAQVLLNYPVWAVWVVAVFYGSARTGLLAWLGRRRGPKGAVGVATEPAGLERIPSVVVVAASAIVTGLGVFVLARLLLGSSGWGVLLAGAVAVPAVVAWGYAWGGPWRFDSLSGARRSAGVRRFASSQLLSVAIALAVLGGWVATGGSPLVGEAVGLLFGSAVGWAWILRGDLLGPTGPGTEMGAGGTGARP
jgi:hypothetical protein